MITIVQSFTFISSLKSFSKSELMSVSQKVETGIHPTFKIQFFLVSLKSNRSYVRYNLLINVDIVTSQTYTLTLLGKILMIHFASHRFLSNQIILRVRMPLPHYHLSPIRKQPIVAPGCDFLQLKGSAFNMSCLFQENMSAHNSKKYFENNGERNNTEQRSGESLTHCTHINTDKAKDIVTEVENQS